MKFEVIKEFRDKESGQIYLVGSNYEVDKQKRADELLDKGFLKGEKKKSKKESK
jgi:hypothetical protein